MNTVFSRHRDTTSEYIREQFTEMIRTLQKQVSEKGNRIQIDELIMERGKSYTKGILFKDDIAVAVSWFSKGAVSPLHHHCGSIEIIFIIEGECDVCFCPENGERRTETYKENQTIVIPADMPHQFYFVEETRIMAKTVPADPSFPKP